MRAVIQAVSSASVRVNGGDPRAIGPGLMILLGVNLLAEGILNLSTALTVVKIVRNQRAEA